MRRELLLAVICTIIIVVLTALSPELLMPPPYMIRYGRDDAIRIAREFLERMGMTNRTRGLPFVVSFAEDSGVVAMYHNLTWRQGLELDFTLNELPAKYWEITWYNYSKGYKLTVMVDPYLGPLGFREWDPEISGSIGYEKALSLAEDAASRSGLVDVGPLRLVANHSEVVGNRSVYTFAWVVRELRAGNLTLTEVLEVKVEGDRITELALELRGVEERGHGLFEILEVMAVTAVGFLGLLGMIAGGLVILVFRRRRTGLRAAFVFMFIIAISAFASSHLQVGMLKSVFGHVAPPELIATLSLALAALMGMLQGIGGFISSFSGLTLSGEVGLDPLADARDAVVKRDPRPLLVSVARGYLIFLLALAVTEVYFYAANIVIRPIVTSYAPFDQLMGSTNTVAFIFFASLLAAVWEECSYRLLAVPLVARYLGGLWTGVIVSSILWALPHYSYPILPRWVKIGQIAALGIVFGYAFVRWGLVPVIVGHYVFDAVALSLTAQPVMGWSSAGLALGLGLAPLILPLMAAAVGRFVRVRALEVPSGVSVLVDYGLTREAVALIYHDMVAVLSARLGMDALSLSVGKALEGLTERERELARTVAEEYLRVLGDPGYRPSREAILKCVEALSELRRLVGGNNG